MKWHIYHKITGEPLCWDKKALEFDTKEDTENFLGSVILNYLGNVEDFDKNTEIKEDILYYDDGYLNATAKNVTGVELIMHIRAIEVYNFGENTYRRTKSQCLL